jgi:hypothetical protein
MSDETPRLIEVGVSVSNGGKIQLKKFEFSSDYHFHLSGKWTAPEDWTDQQAEEFRHEQVLRLKAELEPIVQEEIDDLLEQKRDMEG